MKKLISTEAHGIFDFLSVGALLAVPRLINCSDSLRTALTGAALMKLTWGLMTRHELGLMKVIPMKGHLALDAAGAATVAALPFVLNEDDSAATCFCLSMAATDTIVGAFTETTPSFEKPMTASQRASRARRRATQTGEHLPRVRGRQRQTTEAGTTSR